MRHSFKCRGHEWRVQSDSRGRFDEIVIRTGKAWKRGGSRNVPNDGFVLHAEAMDERSVFVDVAGYCLWVHTGRDGIAQITHTEDRRTSPKQPPKKGKAP